MALLVPGLSCTAGLLAAVLFFALTRKFRAKKVASYAPDRSPHKQRLTKTALPEQVDVIVIGSGIGGLTTAGLLSRVGKKVLVLEQFTKAGGCTHVYDESGVPFDTGVHYLPATMADRNYFLKLIMDMITSEEIEYTHTGQVYDVIKFKDGHEPFPYKSSPRDVRSSLLQRFPTEAAAIDKYFALQHEVHASIARLYMTKVLPPFLSWMAGGRVDALLSEATIYDSLRALTDNKELIAILNGQWANWGLPPRRSSTTMSMMVQEAYMHAGAVYPTNGSEAYARAIIPVIEGSGGRVLVSANVRRILTRPNGQVEGVLVETKGGTAFQVRAPVVVSAAGAANTFTRLLTPENLPKNLAAKVEEAREVIANVKLSLPTFQLFLTLKASSEDLNLPRHNVWAHASVNLDKNFEEYSAGATYPAEDRETGKAKAPMLLFISFPSAKTPGFSAKFPGKSTCEIITEANWEWFRKYEGTEPGKRGLEYKEMKRAITEAMLQGLYENFPHLQGFVERAELGTPLTNSYFLGSMEGSVYGLSFSPNRFSARAQRVLSPKTCIPGLYLSGQDTAVGGVVGAMLGGVASACRVSWWVPMAILWHVSGALFARKLYL